MADAVKCDWCGKFAETDKRPDPFLMNGYRSYVPLPDGWVRLGATVAPVDVAAVAQLEIECCSWECAARRVSHFGESLASTARST